MNADCFFRMGSTHKICQDYAISDNQGLPFGIISDGCTSAERTDFGSRLVTKSAESLVYQQSLPSHEGFLYAVQRLAHTFCRTLSLDDSSLCATLLVAKLGEKAFQTLCVGDGCIAAVRKDGTIQIHEYEFESGAPYYLRYELEDNIKQEYFSRFGSVGTHRTYTISKKDKGHEVLNFEAKDLEFSPEKTFFVEEFPFEEYKGVAVISDGIQSFQKKVLTGTSISTIGIPTHDILYDILDFKGFGGEFLQRQCIYAFKQFTKQEISHYDDFSIAMIIND